jgi:hypothetical protein
MNKVQLLNLLKEGVAAWNRQRKADRVEDTDISRSSVAGLYLRDFDFTYADATGTSFSNCDLDGANFYYAKCDGANFRNANLSYTNFGFASLAEADFTNADLSSADLQNSIGLTQAQVDSAAGDYDTQLPSDLYNPWAEDYDIDPRDDDSGTDDTPESEIPRTVIAPLQTRWRGQRLIASLDSGVPSKVPIADAAHAAADRLARLKEDLIETNADRRLLQLIDDISESLHDLNRRNVFRVGFATEELQYAHDRLKVELSSVLEARMISCVVNLRNLLSMFPAWNEFESAREFDSFRSTENLDIGIRESGAFVEAMARHPETVDESIPVYLASLKGTKLPTPSERFGYFSSLVNVLSRMFSAVLEDVRDGAHAAIAEETKSAVKWILRISAGMVVWFITYVSGAYPWVKAVWQVVKQLL